MGKTTVSNSLQLEQLLTKKFGDRFKADLLSSLMGGVDGTIDSKRFKISFKGDEYLLVSTSPKTKGLLGELLPILTEVMGQQPICSYDLQVPGLDEKYAIPTIEWDVVEPLKRIKEIASGRAFSNGVKILNLKLYGDKEVSEYLDSKEEKEKDEKIYGIYPGIIRDVEIINNLNEVDLYFAIDALGRYIWRCKRDIHRGKMPEIDLTEEEYALEYMIYQTTKFGVELPTPEIGKHITVTPSYNAWYKFYSNHFKDSLTSEEQTALLYARKNGLDTSEFMPSGHWTDLLEKNAQKTLK